MAPTDAVTLWELTRFPEPAREAPAHSLPSLPSVRPLSLTVGRPRVHAVQGWGARDISGLQTPAVARGGSALGALGCAALAFGLELSACRGRVPGVKSCHISPSRFSPKPPLPCLILPCLILAVTPPGLL